MSEDFRDEIAALDPDLIPTLRQFPIEKYAEILRSGKAAASAARYDDQLIARRDAMNVCELLRYYRRSHPELAPDDFGRRVWQSREDGRWRWAILPEARPHRVTAVAR